MNFYKNFIFATVFCVLLGFSAAEPLSLLGDSEPALNVYFISQSVPDGQSVTIKNIAADMQGDWRLAFMGENAAHFRINGQRADFETAGNYVQLPNRLAIDQEWSFMLTAEGLEEGQYSVELTLWTTQGQQQYPFNGTILGSATLYFVVEENDHTQNPGGELPPIVEVPEEPPEEPEIPEETGPNENVPQNPAPNPSPDPTPEDETPEETPQPTREPYFNDDDNNYNDMGQPPETTGRRTRAPQTPPPPQPAPAAPPVVPIVENQPLPREMPREITGDDTINPPFLAALAPTASDEGEEEAEDVLEDADNESVQTEDEPAPPAQSAQNPQTSDSTKFVSMILSFVGLLFSAMAFVILHNRAA